MRPLAIGVAAAVVLAGPPLYSLVQQGSMTGSTALFRGLIVAGVCTIAASFLNGIISDFQKDAKERAEGKVVHHPATPPTPHPSQPRGLTPPRPTLAAPSRTFAMSLLTSSANVFCIRVGRGGRVAACDISVFDPRSGKECTRDQR